MKAEKKITQLKYESNSLRKIAFILTPVEYGGAEQVSLSFLQHYHSNDTVIYPILLCRPWETNNVFINELKSKQIDFCLVPTRIRPKDQGSDYFRLIRSARYIYKELKKGEFDIVHTNGYFADIIGLITSKLCGISIISTCHGFISNSRKFRFYNFLNIMALRFMDRIITVSDELKDEIVEKGVKAKRVEVVQNAVETTFDAVSSKEQREKIRQKYLINDNEFVLGYVGRLSMEKGLKYLIKAVEIVYQKDIPIRLIVVGDGPLSDEIREEVVDRKLEKVVVFTGFQSNVSHFLPGFDVFVLPSLTEGTSMALLEAMACRLPVLATAVGGTPKVITSGENGILIAPESSQELAHEITQLFENQELCRTLGNAALETVVSRFSLDAWLKRVDSIYSELSNAQ